MQPIQNFLLGQTRCWTLAFGETPQGEQLPLLCLPGEAGEEQSLKGIADIVEPAVRSGACAPFCLAGFEPENWERDFTPWPAPAAFRKGDPFTGGAGATLACLPGSGGEGHSWLLSWRPVFAVGLL